MGGFASGLGLLILVIVLLFTWLAVAVFVSPELAAAMGLAVVGLWFLFFVPMGFIKEMIWRSRQQKIIEQAMKAAPAPYQPGTALPPPSATGGPVGGSASGSLMVVDQPGGGGAIDIYRELPQLPQLEPRDHMAAFKRALVLPFVGLFMFFGAQNDSVLHALLEARGMAQKAAVEWDKIKLPAEYADYQSDMNEAARLVLRREATCGAVIGGRLAAQRQFTTAEDQAEQIANEQFVFELDCKGVTTKPEPYLAWVTPEDLNRSSIGTIFRSFAAPPPDDVVRKECLAAANTALQPLQATLQAIIEPTIARARAPYPDYVRLHGNFRLIRANGLGGLIGMSCWAGKETSASVRFTRPSVTLPN